MAESSINAIVEESWTEDMQSLSSLKYINADKVKVEQCHPIWATVRDNVYYSRRAQTKCRLLTGKYTLQSNRAVFSQHLVDPTCKLCNKAPETREHFLVEYQVPSQERKKYLRHAENITDSLRVDLLCPHSLTRLILDPITDSDSSINRFFKHNLNIICLFLMIHLLVRDSPRGPKN